MIYTQIPWYLKRSGCLAGHWLRNQVYLAARAVIRFGLHSKGLVRISIIGCTGEARFGLASARLYYTIRYRVWVESVMLPQFLLWCVVDLTIKS